MFGKKPPVPTPEDAKQQIQQAIEAAGLNGRIEALTLQDRNVALAVVGLKSDQQATCQQAIEGLKWTEKVTIHISSSTPDSPAPEPETPKMNIIAVASGKGGVGKSTIAVNLAFALAAQGARVGLLDADIYGPSIPHMLELPNEKPSASTVDGKQLISPIVFKGVKVMSMGFLVEVEKATIWRGPMVHSAVQQFFNNVDWGDLDHLVIDLPPGTGDVQLTMVQSVTVNGAVVVTTPQDVAMIDARKAFNMFRDTNVPVLGIVQNMSAFTCPDCGHTAHIFGNDGARRWADESETTFLGDIPLDLSIREHGDKGGPFVLSDTDNAASAAFANLADNVLLQIEKRKALNVRQLSLDL
jgi:ATP-binding protein involved in chromosome partitioning